VENNRFFSFIDSAEPYIYLNPKTNTIYPSRADRWSGPEKDLVQIVTSEHETDIIPASWRKKDNAITSRMATKELPGTSRMSDPRKVFYMGNKTLWLSLSQFSQAFQSPDLKKLFGIVIKKKSTGDNITYRIEVSHPGKDKPFGVHIFSSEMGFNQTYFETYLDNGSLRSKKTIEFVKVNGVFLPKKWMLLQYFPEGGLMRQEDCIIENQQINKPIPDSNFSVSSYLHEGDEFRDKITKKNYRFKEATKTLEPIDKDKK
jgi:hypothetical protein